MSNADKDARISILNSLAAYEKGVDAINELIKVTGSDDMVVYGLGLVKKGKLQNSTSG